MAWTIKLTNGKEYNGATASAAIYTTVSELLDGPDWAHIEPTSGPRQLVAWVAVLEALDSESKDLESVLNEVMQRPMVDLLKLITIER